MSRADLFVGGAAQLVLPEPPGLRVVEGGAVAVSGSTVLDLGPESELMERVTVDEGTRRLDAQGGVIFPGLVDPHTHLLFAGYRHAEFAARLGGADYLEILAKGGGILSTVDATRAASVDDLLSLARARLARLLSFGVTAVEVKTGYGLSVDDELRLLRIARLLRDEGPQRVSPTLLGAHAVPREHRAARDRYVAAIVEEMIPQAARAGLADACDVFLEDGAFSSDEARAILGAAKDAGLARKLHAGQFHDLGGAELGAELGAVSVDHLEHVGREGLDRMAQARTVAVLLPGASLSLGGSFADGRRARDAGVDVALGTDCNPGTSLTENLPLMALLGAARMGLTAEEALLAVTATAARAIGRPDLGRLTSGGPADLAVFAIADWRGLLQHFGSPLASDVVVAGKVVLQGHANRGVFAPQG